MIVAAYNYSYTPATLLLNLPKGAVHLDKDTTWKCSIFDIAYIDSNRFHLKKYKKI